MHRKRFATFSWVRQIKPPSESRRAVCRGRRCGTASLACGSREAGCGPGRAVSGDRLQGVRRSQVPASPAAPPRAPVRVQEASVAATIEVVVGRNDTLDAIFRRMALDPADLAAIRHLARHSAKPRFPQTGRCDQADARRPRSSRSCPARSAKPRRSHVVREDSGFAAKLLSNPVQTRIRTAQATIDSSLFQAAEAAGMSDSRGAQARQDLRLGHRLRARYPRGRSIYRGLRADLPGRRHTGTTGRFWRPSSSTTARSIVRCAS